RHVAWACREVGAKLVHVSTDMVFGGNGITELTGWEEEDLPAPVNSYGKTKLAGELAVAEHLGGSMVGQYMVIRTSWLTGDRGWLPWALRTIKAAQPVQMPYRVCRPTLASDLA